MTELRKLELKHELLKVQSGAAGIEVQIQTRLADVEKFRESLAISEKKILEITQKLGEG